MPSPVSVTDRRHGSHRLKSLWLERAAGPQKSFVAGPRISGAVDRARASTRRRRRNRRFALRLEREPIDTPNADLQRRLLDMTQDRSGQHESGTERLEEAVAAFRAALEERTRERVPLD